LTAILENKFDRTSEALTLNRDMVCLFVPFCLSFLLSFVKKFVLGLPFFGGFDDQWQLNEKTKRVQELEQLTTHLREKLEEIQHSLEKTEIELRTKETIISVRFRSE
jgi:hypothetical protein